MMNLSFKKGSIILYSGYFMYVLIVITFAIQYTSATGNIDLGKEQDKGTNLLLMPFGQFGREIMSKEHECNDLPPVLKCICENCGETPEERCIEWCRSPKKGGEANLMFSLHDMISEATERSNCWVCSHGPYSAGGGQWTFVPVTLQGKIRNRTSQMQARREYVEMTARTRQDDVYDHIRERPYVNVVTNRWIPPEQEA